MESKPLPHAEDWEDGDGIQPKPKVPGENYAQQPNSSVKYAPPPHPGIVFTKEMSGRFVG